MKRINLPRNKIAKKIKTKVPRGLKSFQLVSSKGAMLELEILHEYFLFLWLSSIFYERNGQFLVQLRSVRSSSSLCSQVLHPQIYKPCMGHGITKHMITFIEKTNRFKQIELV